MSNTSTKRSFTIKKPSVEVRQVFDQMPNFTNKYKLKQLQENSYRFESSRFFGLIIHIDASYFATQDDQTDVTFEIRPAGGTFNRRHSMEQVQQHLDNIVELFYYCTQFYRTVS